MDKNMKFTWDALSTIRRGHLITPYDDVNLFDILGTPDIEKIILIVNKEMRKDLFDDELKLLEKLMQIHHLNRCTIGYCTEYGFYDPYTLDAKWIGGRCPICHKKLHYN